MDRKLPKKHKGKAIAIAAAVCVFSGLLIFREYKFWQYMFLFAGFVLSLYAAIVAESGKNQDKD